MEPAQLVLSLKLQSDQHAQMIPYNYWERRENSPCKLQLQEKKQQFYHKPAFIYMYYKKSLRLLLEVVTWDNTIPNELVYQTLSISLSDFVCQSDFVN